MTTAIERLRAALLDGEWTAEDRRADALRALAEIEAEWERFFAPVDVDAEVARLTSGIMQAAEPPGVAIRTWISDTVERCARLQREVQRIFAPVEVEAEVLRLVNALHDAPAIPAHALHGAVDPRHEAAIRPLLVKLERAKAWARGERAARRDLAAVVLEQRAEIARLKSAPGEAWERLRRSAAEALVAEHRGLAVKEVLRTITESEAVRLVDIRAEIDRIETALTEPDPKHRHPYLVHPDEIRRACHAMGVRSDIMFAAIGREQRIAPALTEEEARDVDSHLAAVEREAREAHMKYHDTGMCYGDSHAELSGRVHAVRKARRLLAACRGDIPAEARAGANVADVARKLAANLANGLGVAHEVRHPSGLVERVEPERLCVAALVTDPADRVLLVGHRKRGWELPGGGVEPGEKPERAINREVIEEAGIVMAEMAVPPDEQQKGNACAVVGGSGVALLGAAEPLPAPDLATTAGRLAHLEAAERAVLLAAGWTEAERDLWMPPPGSVLDGATLDGPLSFGQATDFQRDVDTSAHNRDAAAK